MSSFLLLVSIVNSKEKIDFNKDVRAILSDKCFFCHGPDKEHRKAKLRLDTREGAIENRKGAVAIDLKNLADSEFILISRKR